MSHRVEHIVSIFCLLLVDIYVTDNWPQSFSHREMLLLNLGPFYWGTSHLGHVLKSHTLQGGWLVICIRCWALKITHNETKVFLEGVEYEPSISIRICGLFLFLVIEKEKNTSESIYRQRDSNDKSIIIQIQVSDIFMWHQEVCRRTVWRFPFMLKT